MIQNNTPATNNVADTSQDFVNRISLKGSLDAYVHDVVKRYRFGKDFSYSIIQVGYEDCNIKLHVDSTNYILKTFSSYKTDDMCRMYVGTMLRVISSGIRHPRIYSANGSYFQVYKADTSTIRYCLLECIEGKSLYDLNVHPTRSEAVDLIHQAAKINTLNIPLEEYYDEWSPIHFSREYEVKKQFIPLEFRSYLKAFNAKLLSLDMSKLSQAFVHNDIIRANVIKDSQSTLTIIDYSKASRKPIIQELSVMLCGMFFDEKNPAGFREYVDLVKTEYVPILSEAEYNVLHLFITAVFGMYLMGGEYCRQEMNLHSKENDDWISLGANGLRYCRDQWP